MRQELSEHQIQEQIERYLRGKGYYVERMNSGRIPQTDAYGKKRFIKLHAVGTPDLMAFKREWKETAGGDGYYNIGLYFIEVKRPGNKPTRLQEWKMQELIEKGAKCLVAYSVDDVEKVIQ